MMSHLTEILTSYNNRIPRRFLPSYDHHRLFGTSIAQKYCKKITIEAHAFKPAVPNPRAKWKLPLSKFDEISQSLKPHPDNALILLEVASEGPTLQEAFEIFKNTGHALVNYEVLKDGSPRLVLILFSPRDIRELVLKLTEKGFTRFKALNPRRPSSNNTWILTANNPSWSLRSRSRIGLQYGLLL